MTTVIEDREKLKFKFSNNEPENESENFDVFEKFDPTQSILPKEILEAEE